jgi:hypothetical protein
MIRYTVAGLAHIVIVAIAANHRLSMWGREPERVGKNFPFRQYDRQKLPSRGGNAFPVEG